MNIPQETHIGQLIKQTMQKQGRKNEWLAEQIGVQASAISKIYQKKSLNTEQLVRISQALGVDFFKMYSSFIEGKKKRNKGFYI